MRWRDAVTRHSLLGRGGIALLLANLAVGASNFAFHAIVSRLLGSAPYGAVGALLNIVFVLAVPLGAISLVVARATAEDGANGDGAVPLRRWARQAAAGGAIGAAAIVGASPFVSGYLRLGSAVPVLLLASWLVPATVGAVLIGALLGASRFAHLAIATIAGMGVFRLLAGIVFVSSGAGIDGAIAATAAGQVVSTLLLATFLRSELSVPSSRTTTPRATEGALNICALIGFWALCGVDAFLARHFLAPAQAGRYVAASIAGGIALFIPGSVSLVAFPKFVAAEGEGVDARRTLTEALGLVALLGFGVAGLIAAAPRIVVGALFGEGYGPSVQIIGILALSAAVMGMVSILTYFHLARRSAMALMPWGGVGLAVTLVSLIRTQPKAIAWVMLVSSAATALVLLGAAYRPRARRGTTASNKNTVRQREPSTPTSGRRILIFNWRDAHHPLAGGAEVYTHEVARGWVNDGHQVTLFCSRVRGRPPVEHIDGIRVVRRGGTHTVYGAARRFYKRDCRGAFDLVVDEINTRPFAAVRFVRDAPVIAVIHQVAREVWHYEAPFPLSLIGRFILEPLWLRAYRDTPVVTVSESSRESLEAYGLRYVSVIPEGSSPPFAIPPTSRPDRPTIVFVGRLAWNKRPTHAIRALKLLRRRLPQAELVVVGSGPLHARLRRRVPSGVTIHGRASEEEKYALMARAHAVVVTSVREGWGLVVDEAHAVGTPVVAYDVPGLRDSVRSAGGMVVQPSPRALADALAEQLPDWVERGWVPPPRRETLSWREVGRRILAVAGDDEPRTTGSVANETSVTRRQRSRLAAVIATARAVALAAGTVGAAGVAALGLLVRSGRGDAAAAWTLAALALATAAAGVAVAGTVLDRGAHRREVAPVVPTARIVGNRWLDGTGVSIVIATALAGSYSWFSSGSAVAGGDLSPPDGMAWISKMFGAWEATGSDFGRPGVGQLGLPWAAVLRLVHAMGGSENLAQQLWCMAVFSLAAAACFCLMRACGVSRVGCALGAFAYCFNPFVMTSVGPNPLFLVPLAMIPGVAFVVVAAGRNKISVWTGAIALAATAPLLGYTFTNPPLTVIVAATMCLSPVGVLVLWGRTDASRSARTVLLALPLLTVLSLYWVVPALLALGDAATAKLSALSDWAWTERRAGLANAFWLNTSWAFSDRGYFGFGTRYDQLPLLVVRYFAPAVAVAAIPLTQARRTRYELRRLCLVGATVAIFFVLLATGTRWPGRLVFIPLYNLPLGWLLREPGRMLFFACLGYAVLVGVTADVVGGMLRNAATRTVAARRQVRLRPSLGTFFKAMLGTCLVASILFTNAPLALGEVVARPGQTYNVARVSLPAYWASMADYVNSRAGKGNLLVLPPDDFYQMPYTWGYYGVGGFIRNLFDRDVLNPSREGYWSVQGDVVDAVDLVSDAAIAGNWELVDRLIVTLHSRFILVRGDVDAHRPGRAITPPDALDTALRRDPKLRMVHRDGPLTLFERRDRAVTHRGFFTVESEHPDLRDLEVLETGDALISGPMRHGVPAVIEPPESDWHISGVVARMKITTRPGWTYDVRELGVESASPAPSTAAPEGDDIQVDASRRGSLHVSLPIGENLLTNGGFRQGPWQSPPGDCAGYDARAKATMTAAVNDAGGPDGSPFLRMAATEDSACESSQTRWTDAQGFVLVRVQVRHVAGGNPRVCLYAVGPNRCLALPPMSTTRQWSTYSAFVHPPSDTTALALFLYSDAGQRSPTTNDYANAGLYRLTRRVIIVASPTEPPSVHLSLVEVASSYSRDWVGPTESEHVLVDGMKNGWLLKGSARVSPRPHYGRSTVVLAAAIASGSAAIVVGFTVICVTAMRRRRRGGVAK